MTERGLVPADEKYLQSVSGMGLEGIPSEVLPIPRVNLVQFSTKNAILKDGSEAKPGWYYNTGTQDAYETLPCSVLRAGVSRVKFDPDFTSGPPLCRSRDGVFSAGGQRCVECEFSKWTDKPPECSLNLDFICVRDEDRSPFLISASRTSFAAARKALMSMIFSKLPAFGHQVVLESKQVDSKKGKFFVMVWRILGPRPVKEIKELEQLYRQYGGVLPEASEEAATEGLEDRGNSKGAEIEPENHTVPTGDEEVDPKGIPF
jgi:hypothetical protein